jgi:ribonuclease Z
MGTDRIFAITPLGSSSAVPMHGRHLSSVLVRAGTDQVIIDCGEGTQFQLRKCGFKPRRLKAILISHLHGDHWYGLPGLLASLSLSVRTQDLILVGPSDFTVRWLELDHPMYCVGYRLIEDDAEGNLRVLEARSLGISDVKDFQRLKSGDSVENKIGQVVAPSDVITPGAKGRVFGYVSDSRPCKNGVLIGQDADLLLHEATFLDDMKERAEATGHSTAIEAATIAMEANAKKLVLTHFSARYEDAVELVAEAKTVFANTEAVVELEPIEIDCREVRA